jgi:uncharacterized FlaG/YvyC family protein
VFFKKKASQQHSDSEQNYTYPQFVIDEKTGRVDVNFIDWASGRVVRHIPASELNDIVRKQGLDSEK